MPAKSGVVPSCDETDTRMATEYLSIYVHMYPSKYMYIADYATNARAL